MPELAAGSENLREHGFLAPQVRNKPEVQQSMKWPEYRHAAELKGQWVALDNCRYAHDSLQPIEGDVVDADEDLAALCGRMRKAGKTSCAIFFCDRDLTVRQSA